MKFLAFGSEIPCETIATWKVTVTPLIHVHTTAGTILIIVSLINIFLLVTLFQNFTLTSYNDQISDRQSI